MKTVHLALVMALNYGIDPPDIIRNSPSSRMECWIDPTELPMDREKAAEIISRVLQEQVIIIFLNIFHNYLNRHK